MQTFYCQMALASCLLLAARSPEGCSLYLEVAAELESGEMPVEGMTAVIH